MVYILYVVRGNEPNKILILILFFLFFFFIGVVFFFSNSKYFKYK